MLFGASRNSGRKLLGYTLLLSIAVLGSFLLPAQNANAAVGINQQMNFQGRLFNAQGATVPDGYYNIEFKIYQDGPGTAVGNPGGTLKWTETYLNNNSNGVLVKNGYLSVELGSITAFGSSVDWNQSVLWLSLNVGSTNASCTPFSSCTPDGEMVPMKRMTSTPYSLNSGQLGGKTSEQFVQLAQGVQTEASNNTSSIYLNKTGTAGNFLQLQSAGADAFTLTSAGDIAFGANANHTISIATSAADIAGRSMTVTAGAAGTGAAALAGGNLVLQGGTGGGTNGNGGNVNIDAGVANGTGTNGAINIGTSNAAAINLGQNTTLAAGKSLTITGSGTRPSPATEGMVYYDTTTKQLLTYSNGKWQADSKTAAFIVAASDSTQADKDGAQYVANGEDSSGSGIGTLDGDQIEINQALAAAAAAKGGTVYLAPGTYTIDGSISIPNNVTLAGSGASTLIQLGNFGATSTNINMIANTDTVTGTGITIRDLKLDGRKSTNTSGTMRGIYLINMGGGSGASARAGALISGNKINSVSASGINLSNSNNSTISNNVSFSNSYGVYLGNSSNNNTVTTNVLRRNSSGGISIYLSSNNSISGNVLQSNVSYGIAIDGSVNNTVSGNNIFDSGSTTENGAVYLVGSDSNTITSNDITDTSATTTNYAINISNNTSDFNYLADNRFSSTATTSTINDAGTGTVYANQSRAENGGQLTNRTADNTAAFTVQNASGAGILTADTTNGEIEFGSASLAGKLVISDGSSNTVTLSVGALAGDYTLAIPTMTTNDTVCLLTAANCVNGSLFIQNQNASQQAASNFWISGVARADTSIQAPLLDTATAVALNIGTTNATVINLNEDTTVAAGKSITLVGGAYGTRPASPTLGMLYYDTTSNQLLQYNGTKWVSDRSTATKIVAASNSSQAIKDGADYVADGTSDQTEINSALTAAAGGKVYLAEGTYTVTASVSIPNNTTLAGAGYGTVITIPNSHNADINAITNTTTGGNGTGVVIKDLRLEGNGANQTAGTMRGVYFNGVGSGSGASAVQGGRISGVWSNNWRTGSTGTGIYLSSSANNTVIDNVTQGNGSIGIYLNSSSSNAINNNITQGSATGIYLNAATNNTITGNVIRVNTNSGISLLTTSNNNVVSSNKLTNNGSDANNNSIYIDASDGNSITDNNIVDYSSTGTNYSINIINNTSDNNYLADNYFSSNATDSTINDAGTGTTFANQPTAENGMNLLNRTLNSTTAFAIQGTNKVNVLNVDTTNGEIELGSSALTGKLVLSDGSSNTVTLSVAALGGDYTLGIPTLTANDTLCLVTAANCANGTMFIQNQNASQQAASNFWISGVARADTSLQAPTLDTATAVALNIGNTTASAINIGKTTTNITTTISGTTIIKPSTGNDSTTLLQVQNAAGTNNMLTVNTVNSRIAINQATATRTLDVLGDFQVKRNGGSNVISLSFPSANEQLIEATTGGTFTIRNTQSILRLQTASTTRLYLDGTNNAYFGDPTSASPSNFAINGGGGSGTDVTGANLTIAGGKGTGAANGGSIIFQTTAADVTGTTLNSLATMLTLQGGTGAATFQNTANSTSAFAIKNLAGTNLFTVNTQDTTVAIAADTSIAANKSLRLTGGAYGTRPASPTEGMVYFDSTSKQLITYSNGKWQADSKTAAFIVAASDSTQADKDGAQYVANGEDSSGSGIGTLDGDQIEINAALTAAGAAKGGTVYLAPGTYTIDAAISIPNNVTLAGSGASTLIQLGNFGATSTSINSIINTDTATGTNVVVRDLKLDGRNTINTAGNQYGVYMVGMGNAGASPVRHGAKIANVQVSNFRKAGIYLEPTNNSTLTNNISQNNEVGIYIYSGVNTMLTGNITNNNTTGISIGSSSHNTLTGNTSRSNSTSGIAISGEYNTVTGNVADTNGTGIYGENASRNTVSGNTVQGNSTGIFFYVSSPNNIISSNNIIGNTNTGVLLRSGHNTVSGNNIHDSGGANSNTGISIGANTTIGDSNSIIGNTITDTQCDTTCYAINIENVDSENNYLSENRISDTDGDDDSSIQDLGTGTVYANQSRAENGSQLTNRTANDTAAFTIQNASGANLLTADTTNGEVELGSASLAGKLVLSDGSSNTGTLLLGALSGNYTYTVPTTTANDEFCLLTLGNCTAAGDYVQNQDASAQTANFWIDGTGKVGGGLQSPSLDTITAGALNVGTSTATSVTVGKSAGTITLASATTNLGTSGTSTTLQAAAQATTNTPGNSFTIQGAAGNGTGNGGSFTLAGGLAGGTSGANGGDITVTGGAGSGTGTKGLVKMSATSFTTATNGACAADCTITQSYVDANSTIIISSTGTDITITLPAPTNTTQGRLAYITTSTSSNDFTLAANSGADALSVTMRKNTTATMVWNGSAWTPGGASNAITLQATYNNGSNPSTTPEIMLDSVRGTIDIQDADTTIGADLLNVRGSNPSGLGTVLFGVSNTGRVTIQGTSDQSSAFRVLNATGDYLLNVNSANNYIINNSIRPIGNQIHNPGFESGGAITGGEEGWFGASQATIENATSNSRTGNHQLRVLPNGTNLDVYAGSYYEVNVGEEIYFGGYVKNSSGTNGTAGLQITWYDKDKASLSSSTDYASLPGTTYVLRKVNAVAPANAVYARVSAAVRSSSTTGFFYFDDFTMTRNVQTTGPTFRNTEDSTTSFRIQSAASAQTLFTANTTDNILKVGDSTGTDTAMTMLVLDSATADPTTLSNRNGGLFYRSDNNSLKAVIGGAVVDICTTAVTCTGYSASAGSSIQLQGTSPGTAQTGHFNITGTGILTQLQTQDNGSGSTQALVVRTGNATGGNSGNLTLDVGTATGTVGTITIGHAGVATTMAGTLKIQGANTLELGNSSSANGSILFRTSSGANTVTLRAPSANPTSSYTLTLPTDLGAAGECIKTDAGGGMYFQGCGVGVNFDLQDAYDNTGTPANIALADGKDFKITATDTSTTDPNVLVNLACTTSCSTNGRFAIQNGGTDVLTVLPNSGGIVLSKYTQIGSATTDATQVNLQLDSYNGTSDSGACSTTVNQGAIYYNTSMGSLRSCINGSWSDVSNPDTLGLLTFGIVPSSGGGSNAYDLPSLVTNGSSGPCKVSWASNNSVYIQSCVAYSSGRRVNVASTTLYTNTATTNNTNLTTTNRYGHVCLTGSNNTPAFTSTSGVATALNGLPTFDATSPVLCLATVVGSATTAGLIDDIFDVRTFTSAMKEAVNTSTALELGMIADAGTTGAMQPAVSASQKLYGSVVATDGATSAGAPNAIVTTVGPAWVKANAGTAGQFVKTSTTNGFANTIASIPNNSFYYSVGNTRTAWSTTCTASTNCAGSLYINLIVR